MQALNMKETHWTLSEMVGSDFFGSARLGSVTPKSFFEINFFFSFSIALSLFSRESRDLYRSYFYWKMHGFNVLPSSF